MAERSNAVVLGKASCGESLSLRQKTNKIIKKSYKLNVCSFFMFTNKHSRLLLPAAKRHSIKSCRDVSFEFMKDGIDIFHK